MQDLRRKASAPKLFGRVTPGGSDWAHGSLRRGQAPLLRILMGLGTADHGVIEGQGLRLSAVFPEDRLCDHLSPVSNIRLVHLR